jgi:hypothetical protein
VIVVSSQAVGVVFTTQNIDGVSTNATGTPTGTLYVDGTANGAVITVSNVTTGLYKASFTIPASQPNYTQLELVVSATVDGIAAKAKVWTGTVLRVITQTVVGRATDDEAVSPNVSCIVGETGVTKSVTVEDSAGEPIDLTDWGAKVLTIENALNLADVQVIENAGITVSGDDNEIFTFQPDSTVLAQPGDFLFSLREVSSGEVIIDGTLTVSYSPLEDEE